MAAEATTPFAIEGELTCPGPWCGGWAFDAQREWSGFPAERWVLPEVLAWWDGSQTYVAAFGPSRDGVDGLYARLEALTEAEPVLSSNVASVIGGTTREAWASLVEGAVSTIRTGAVGKVVVAREIELHAASAISERRLLKALEARQPQSFTFGLRGTDGSFYVGATPELLCDVRGSQLRTEALAGSAPRSVGSALLGSPKDRAEHRFVVDGIREVLTPFSKGLDIPSEPTLRELPHLVHLRTPIVCELKSDVDALTVAKALHPTPAVCGTPRQPALEWLRANEGFDRGWYAGAVGMWGQRAGQPAMLQMCVAIRSALIRDDRIHVFVGCGIVEGSDAAREWDETQLKAKTMFDVLGAEARAP